jgi:hypothetical protein
METVIVILALIFVILAWNFVIDPILEGMGGFTRNLVKKAMEDNKPDSPEFRACHHCGQVSQVAGIFCPHCGTRGSLHTCCSRCGRPYPQEACSPAHALIWEDMKRLHSIGAEKT